MRQTQRTAPAVVALLLALGADARVGLVNTVSPNNAPFPDAVTGTSKKWGIANGNHSELALKAKGDGTAMADYLDWKTSTNKEEGSCVSCIRSGYTWCSNQYLAEIKDTGYVISVKLQNAVSTNKNVVTPATLKATVDSTSHDLGQCCYANGAVEAATTGALKATAGNKVMCAAAFGNDTGSGLSKVAAVAAGPATTLVYIKSTAQKWWCSDGKIANTSDSAPTQVITAYSIAPNTAAVNPNGSASAANADPRTEFWLTNCRQRQDTCGGAALIATPAVGTYVDRTVAAQAQMYLEKCTWILQTNGKGAPTFKVAKVTAIIDPKFDLHYIEYSVKGTDTTGLDNQPGSETNGETSLGSTLLPLISANTGMNLLAGRLYDKDAYKGYIEQPLVWMWADQSKAVTSTSPYYKKKRWFPPAIAEKEVADYKALSSTYTAATGAFNTLKAAYETAMTPKESDFFSDLFNPPKKTAPPLRPAKPTDLAAYGGLRMAAKANTNTYLYAGAAIETKLKDVAANEFVLDGGYGGGWGAFTMGLLHIEDGMGKSFGVFGWSATDGEKASYSQMAKHMCPTAEVGTDGFCTTTNDSISLQVLVVSLWAVDPDAADTTSSKSMKISFTQTAWASKKDAWGAPATPTLAVDSKTTFGAQALAASTVAAVAVASALY